MILVAGGTGFIGTAVVSELIARGEAVAVLGRDGPRARRKFGDAVEAREADVRRPGEELDAAMRGIDVAVNCVQFPNSPIEDKARGWTFEEVDLKGTRHQVDAARRAGVRRFVYVSGIGADAESRYHWFRAKAEAEACVRESGLEWVIVRPTWVYGPEDNSLNRLLGFGNFLPVIPTFGDGRQAMQPVFIDDVARVVADSALRAQAAGHVFELGGPEVMSMDEVFKIALEVQGRKRPILHQPVFAGKALGTIAGLLPKKLLTADSVEFIIQPAVADNSEVEAILHPRLTPFREALGTYLAK
jgi:uncharacterized protein YbjT (DUF2867 family)